MERLSEYHFFQSHYIIGTPLPKYNNEENQLKTLLDWLDFMENDEYGNYRNLEILDRVESIDFIHFIDLDSFREIVIDLYKIHTKHFPYSEPNNFLEYILSVTKYEIENLLQNENRIIWSGDRFNQYNFYYFLNDGSEREYFCLDQKIHIESLFQYYRKVLKIIDEFLVNAIEGIIIEKQPNFLDSQIEITKLYKYEKSNLLFEYFINHWNYIRDMRFSYLFNYFQENHDENIYKTDFERYIRERFNFVGKFQYDKTSSVKNFKQLAELENKFSEK